MIYKVCENTVVLRLEKGEEILSSIKKVCEAEDIKLGTISGLGAVDYLSVGLYKTKEKEYISNVYQGEFEISSLIGNVTTKNSKVYLHIHATFSDVKNKVVGGHLNKAIVSATAEIFILKVKGTVERELDDTIGLNLMKF
ncbi:hypothetical protein BX659_1309 [Orenia metallireducens]|uniref:PPC domain-containing protein n=1 Tax=Orenia metallireducens TaxID=1413210 RepID=A0A285GZY1_9FIRM|nr:PPC domain-containing DNA-binding protein [Orenia metallireducens]PRX21789.1 hypothetical protein BX659_1309 [Orenia metallireducens]SNY29028.1 hypothetical protein SAMN06265827_11297 [Orenia metallireducens]